MAEAHGFIDGDLVEAFLDLPRAQQEEVVGILQVRRLVCFGFGAMYVCVGTVFCFILDLSVWMAGRVGVACGRKAERSQRLTTTITPPPPTHTHTQADGITSSGPTTTAAPASASSDAMDMGGEGDKKAAGGAAGQGAGGPVTVEEVYRRVEEMTRLH